MSRAHAVAWISERVRTWRILHPNFLFLSNHSSTLQCRISIPGLVRSPLFFSHSRTKSVHHIRLISWWRQLMARLCLPLSWRNCCKCLSILSDFQCSSATTKNRSSVFQIRHGFSISAIKKSFFTTKMWQVAEL